MESESVAAINVTGTPEVELNPNVEVEQVVDTNLPSETGDMIDGKFKSQDDLLAAYHALQTKLGGGPDVSTVDETPEQSEVPTDIVNEFANKIQEQGGITPDIYSELAQRGYSKQFVDTYVSGLNYACSSDIKGVTNEKGEYTCNVGDSVEFSIGSYVIGLM